MKAIIASLDQAGLVGRKHQRAIDTAREITAVAALQDYERFVRRWSKKPRFRITRKGDTTEVSTDDPVFKYQDEGTRGPYPITPRRKRALYWKGARHPVKRVMHPGLKAQRFTEAVQANADRRLPEETARQLAAVAGRG